MGRGRRREAERVVRPRAQETHVGDSVAPAWGDFAAECYGELLADELVSERLRQRFGVDVSADEVADYLASRRDVVRRKQPKVRPFAHENVSPTLTDAGLRRIDEEAAA